MVFDVEQVESVQCDFDSMSGNSAIVQCVIYSKNNELITQFETSLGVNSGEVVEDVFFPILRVTTPELEEWDDIMDTVFDSTKLFDGRSFIEEEEL